MLQDEKLFLNGIHILNWNGSEAVCPLSGRHFIYKPPVSEPTSKPPKDEKIFENQDEVMIVISENGNETPVKKGHVVLRRTFTEKYREATGCPITNSETIQRFNLAGALAAVLELIPPVPESDEMYCMGTINMAKLFGMKVPEATSTPA
ncbi:MAG: hypothetical protein PHR36_01630 [Patescibacteria group bacterium]|nr:hypothetical protein [Patescibacteria group bacterium]